MTSNRWDAWEPQEPPEDFAERTVATALEEALREPRARRRGRRERWALLAAAAVMLVGGAAWGFSAWSVSRASRLAPVATPPAPAPARSMQPLLIHSFTPPDAGNPAPVAAPVVARPRRPQAPESAPDAGRKVIVPACDCAPDQVMCTCF
jgi:hypothetical protein